MGFDYDESLNACLVETQSKFIKWRTVTLRSGQPLSKRLLGCIWAISCGQHPFQTKTLRFAKHRWGSFRKVFPKIILYWHILSFILQLSIQHFFTTDFSLKLENELCGERMFPGPLEQIKTRLIFILLCWYAVPAKELTDRVYSHKGIVKVQRFVWIIRILFASF